MNMRKEVEALRTIAHRAGQNITFHPDEYGERLLVDLENQLNWFLSQIPEGDRDYYQGIYIDKYRAWMNAQSRCFSVMITGGSGFNNRRHEKTNNAADAALKHLEEWSDRIIKRANAQHRKTGWDEVERQNDKLEILLRQQELMKAVNKIVRSKTKSEVDQLDELMGLGLSEENAVKLMSEPVYAWCKKGFQSYELSSINEKIKRARASIASHASMATKIDREIEIEGGKIVLCYSEERIRIFYNEIPSAEERSRLKSASFKWSPANKAWQRQLTTNAIYATKKLFNL